MERRGFLASLGAALMAGVVGNASERSPEPTPLTRIDIDDGFMMVDADKRVHRFESTRADAPHWTVRFPNRFTSGKLPLLQWRDPRARPNDCPYVLVMHGESREFHACRRPRGALTYMGVTRGSIRFNP